MTDWYAPNQQAVRSDSSGPAETGEGGAASVPPEPPPQAPTESLDALTKDQLLALAAERGVAADASMTKAEIKAALEGA